MDNKVKYNSLIIKEFVRMYGAGRVLPFQLYVISQQKIQE